MERKETIKIPKVSGAAPPLSLALHILLVGTIGQVFLIFNCFLNESKHFILFDDVNVT